jgi:hypothetical protein
MNPIRMLEQTRSGRTSVITYQQTVCLLSHFVTHNIRLDKPSAADGYRDRTLLNKCYKSTELRVRADILTAVFMSINILPDMASHRLAENHHPFRLLALITCTRISRIPWLQEQTNVASYIRIIIAVQRRSRFLFQAIYASYFVWRHCRKPGKSSVLIAVPSGFYASDKHSNAKYKCDYNPALASLILPFVCFTSFPPIWPKVEIWLLCVRFLFYKGDGCRIPNITQRLLPLIYHHLINS